MIISKQNKLLFLKTLVSHHQQYRGNRFLKIKSHFSLNIFYAEKLVGGHVKSV